MSDDVRADAEQNRPPSLLIWLFARALVQGAFSILIARELGPAGVGTFMASLSLAGSLVPWMGFGLSMAMMQRIASHAAPPEEEFYACLSWYLRTFPMLAAIGLLLTHMMLPASWLSAMLVVTSELITSIVDPLTRIAQGQRNFNRMGRLTVGTSLVRFLAVMGALLLLPGSLKAVCWSYLCVNAIYVTVLLLYTVRSLDPPILRSKSTLRPSDGIPFATMACADKVNAEIDKTVLSWAGLNSVAGNYGTAYSLVSLSALPVMAAVETSAPDLFSAAAKGRNALLAKLAKVMRTQLLLVLVSGVVLYLAAPLAPIVFGTRFIETVPMVRQLSMLPAVLGVWLTLRIVAIAIGFKRWCTICECLVAAAVVASLLGTVPEAGWGAAVIITYASYLLMAFLFALPLIRLIRVPSAQAADDNAS